MMAAEPAAIPVDVLAEVLRRLAPLVLAASRRVCRAWRDAVDARLRGHLLSRSVHGIFINYSAYSFSEFFYRPSTGPAIFGGLDFLPAGDIRVVDHCHGLLLCGDWEREREYVVNPATKRWARLPRRPPLHIPGFGQSAYLAFDPAVSPHYEVLVIPRLQAAGESGDEEGHHDFVESEWPPASYVLQVFSSMADRWDEKTFLREGEASGIVADMNSDRSYDGYQAVYCRSALYIHCQHGYLVRMSLTNHTYRVIRLPGPNSYHLGRSVGGVYCAEITYQNRLQLWHLDESRDQTGWVLKHDINLETFARKFLPLYYRKMSEEDPALQMGQPWKQQHVNYSKFLEEHDGNRKCSRAPVEKKYDWNSDEDNVLDMEDVADGGHGGGYRFVGFHPYKEIVYLDFDMGKVVAYAWNSSRFQFLATFEPEDHIHAFKGTGTSFTYTPCWMGEFPGNELESQLEDEDIARKNLELEAQLEDTSNFTCATSTSCANIVGVPRGSRTLQTKLVADTASQLGRNPTSPTCSPRRPGSTLAMPPTKSSSLASHGSRLLH